MRKLPKLLLLSLLALLLIYALITFRLSPIIPFFPSPSCITSEPPPPLSLYDVKPVFGRKMRMLFMTHGYNYEVGMDRHFFVHYHGLRNHKWIEVHLWGIGISDYNTSITLRDNLMHKYGELYFDVMYLYGMLKGHEIKELSQEIIVLVREHECWEKRCIPFFTGNGARLVMLTYAPEVPSYIELAQSALVVHSPHTSNSEIFFGDPLSTRDIDVLLVGRVDSKVYPLRARFRDLIESGKIPGGQIRQHPGYFFKNWDESFWTRYDLNMSNTAIVEKQVYEYADLLQRAKICFIDSSVYKYALQKYNEIPMSGCMPIGDVPHERMNEIRDWIEEVDMSTSDEKIIEIVKYWLDHPDERIARAKKAQTAAMKYNVEAWGDTVIRSVNRIHTQGFGLVMDHQFELTCTAESIPSGKDKNIYCKG